MRKMLLTMFGFAMAFVLTACAGATPGGTPPAVVGVPDAEVVAQGGAVTVWCWDPAFNIFSMNIAAEIYQRDHNPNFVLDIQEVPWAEIQTRIATATMAGTLDVLPNILLMQDNAFQRHLIDFPEIFVDLTDSGIDYSQFSPGKVAFGVMNDRIFTVPFDNGTVVTLLRTDVIERAGYTIDDFTDITWDEFYALGVNVLEQTGYPLISDQLGAPHLLSIMIRSTGTSFFHDDGSLYMVGNDVLRQAMQMYLQLREAGILVGMNNWDEYIGSFIAGDVAGVVQGCWIIGSVTTAVDQSGHWAVTNVPRMAGVDTATNFSSQGGASWTVINNGQDPSLAIDFLRHTFAGSVELYERILPTTGALATFLPAGDSAVYNEPQEFFGGQAVFADITRFAASVPVVPTGLHYFDARNSIGTALVQIAGGMDIDQAIREAQDTVAFLMMD